MVNLEDLTKHYEKAVKYYSWLENREGSMPEYKPHSTEEVKEILGYFLSPCDALGLTSRFEKMRREFVENDYPNFEDQNIIRSLSTLAFKFGNDIFNDEKILSVIKSSSNDIILSHLKSSYNLGEESSLKLNSLIKTEVSGMYYAISLGSPKQKENKTPFAFSLFPTEYNSDFLIFPQHAIKRKDIKPYNYMPSIIPSDFINL